MDAEPLGRTTASASATTGGALIALGALIQLLHLLSTGAWPLLSLLATVAVALGAVVLAADRDGIVGASRIGRAALVVLGVGPLLFLLPIELLPVPPVLVGTSLIVLVALATVVAAVAVVRAGALHGVARWGLVVVAIDALGTAAMSTVPLGGFPLLFMDWHLELIRPLALLVWGVAVVLHGQAGAVRRFAAVWRRSTDVGGAGEDASVRDLEQQR